MLFDKNLINILEKKQLNAKVSAGIRTSPIETFQTSISDDSANIPNKVGNFFFLLLNAEGFLNSVFPQYLRGATLLWLSLRRDGKLW